MQTDSISYSDPYAETPEERLERGGFTRKANPHDFEAIVEAVKAVEPCYGLLFAGGVGCGKTTAARAVVDGRPIIRAVKTDDVKDVLSRGFRSDVLSRYSLPRIGGDPSIWDNWERSFVLDDLGAEARVNDFGVMHEYAAELLVEVLDNPRYWMESPVIITTNLTARAIAERYGERVASRLFSRFYTVKFTAQDLRKPLRVFG